MQFVQGVVHLAKNLEVAHCDDAENDHLIIRIIVSLLQESITDDYWEITCNIKKIKSEESNDCPVLNHADWARIVADVSRKCASINFFENAVRVAMVVKKPRD